MIFSWDLKGIFRVRRVAYGGKNENATISTESVYCVRAAVHTKPRETERHGMWMTQERRDAVKILHFPLDHPGLADLSIDFPISRASWGLPEL